MKVSGLGYLSSFLVIALISKKQTEFSFKILAIELNLYQILAMIVTPRERRGVSIFQAVGDC